VTLHNLSRLDNKLRFAFNDETKQIHVVRVTSGNEEDLGAIGIPSGITALKTEMITMTAASATLKSLLAGGAYQAGVKRVFIKAAAPWSFAIGAAAVMGAVTLDAGIGHEIPCTEDTDLRVIAGGSVAAFVEQEG